MANDFSAALAIEIADLESQLERDPRFTKLRELNRVKALYDLPERVIEQRVRTAATTSGRSPSPERQAILHSVKMLLDGLEDPTSTSEIYDMLIKADVTVPGTNPKNNLSAMLSNSPHFHSHGKSGWTLSLESPETSGADLESGSPEVSHSASPADPPYVRPVDPVPGGGG